MNATIESAGASRRLAVTAAAVTLAGVVLSGPVGLQTTFVPARAGALWTAADPGWVFTGAGLGLFGIWNGLMMAMSTLALLALRGRGAVTLGGLANQS
jgi:hypothetical protein